MRLNFASSLLLLPAIPLLIAWNLVSGNLFAKNAKVAWEMKVRLYEIAAGRMP